MTDNLTPEQLAAFESFMEEDPLAFELAALDAAFPVPESEPKPEEEEERQDPGSIARARLSMFPNAPTQEEIDGWLERYGDEGVFLVALAPEDVFVLRFIKAGEHRKILQHGQALRQRIAPDDFAAAEALEEELKFLVAKTCTLWYPGSPAPLTKEYIADSRAGLLNNLVSVVNINSYFFNDPQQILNFTTVLR